MKPSKEELLKLADRLAEYSERGVFTAEHRWQDVVDAVIALRACAAFLHEKCRDG